MLTKIIGASSQQLIPTNATRRRFPPPIQSPPPLPMSPPSRPFTFPFPTSDHGQRRLFPQPPFPWPRPCWSQLCPRPRRPTTELALFTPPQYAAPPPPQHWPPRGSGGASFPGGPGGSAVPVGDGGGSGNGGAARVGGSPLGRKREAAADGGGEGDRMYNCSVCNKAFSSPRAVFGHMRKHPDRGWTGAHPPPAFRAEEEFADLPVNIQILDVDTKVKEET
ncbi:zinc finger family protein [Salvia divinorum]|uniref:Zinc finger family protein n=1 Tax=Salvia divinorum TaxID=28513 RepID=A0ABD1FZF6_SALDI